MPPATTRGLLRVPKPHVYSTEAVVLRTRPLGEADRLLTLFTPTFGKITATARGVRKPTSKLGGHLDLLTRSSLTLAKGRTLDTITTADTLQGFLPVKSNLQRLSQALYLVELVDALNPLEASNPPAYALLLEGLAGLGTEADPHLLLRYLEIRLLAHCGFLPELHQCTECHTTLIPGEHLFSPQAGGVLCPACRSLHADALHLSLDALKVLRYLSTATRESATRLRLSQPLRSEVASLLRAFLQSVLEREVRSLSFLRSLSREEPGAPVSSPVSS